MKRILIILILMTLTGCSALTTMHPPDRGQQEFYKIPHQDRQAMLRKITRWGATGALSIDEVNRKSVIAQYEWVQTGPSHYRVRLTSALNLYTADIYKSLKKVTLWTDDKAYVTANTVETAMQRRLGWSLPIDGMEYWMKGMPAPGPRKARYDGVGHLIQLHQSGWDIYYSDYINKSGVDLPTVINLIRPGFRVRIIIKIWTLYMHDTMYTDKRTLPCYKCRVDAY